MDAGGRERRALRLHQVAVFWGCGAPFCRAESSRWTRRRAVYGEGGTRNGRRPLLAKRVAGSGACAHRRVAPLARGSIHSLLSCPENGTSVTGQQKSGLAGPFPPSKPALSHARMYLSAIPVASMRVPASPGRWPRHRLAWRRRRCRNAAPSPRGRRAPQARSNPSRRRCGG